MYIYIYTFAQQRRQTPGAQLSHLLMKYINLLSFAAMVLGIDAQRSREAPEARIRDYPLQVSLEHLGGTQFKASLHNGGAESLNLAWASTLLDTADVNKVQVRRADTGKLWAS